MGRGQTSEEFAAEHGPLWFFHGGLSGDPGIVSDAARKYGDLYELDAEALDDAATADGWESHDRGYDDKVHQLAINAVVGVIKLKA